jgi:pyruvate dehydrogenase E2 component (dihydrolipoamide acetyltransferase)
MAEFVMPSLGADMDEGTVVEWLVKVGDIVKRGDIVAVVDTTKSAIEVEVFTEGVVEKILVEPGTTVPVGTPLAVLGQDDASVPAAPAEPAAPPAEEVRADESGSAGEPPVASPIVRHLAHERGLQLRALTGSGPDGVITRSDVETAAAALGVGSPAPTPARPSEGQPGRVVASPLAKRTATELGVDLAGVTGTGPGGAVTVSDVHRAAEATPPAPEPAMATPQVPEPPILAEEPRSGVASGHSAKISEGGGQSAKIADGGAAAAKQRAAAMRTTIANLMARSKKEIPHYYLRTTVDFAPCDDFVRRYNTDRPVSERLLPAVLLLKASAMAVRKVPEVNGFFTEDGFARSEAVHLGVAISLRGGGLVAPAIHDADTLPLADLMAALKDLVARTRAGRLRGSEMSDPTITITNLGEQGVEVVHGVIYPPQVALVGFGTIVQRPWAVDGMLTVRPVLTATLAADHRVSDGHRGGLYLAAVANLLQRPEEL